MTEENTKRLAIVEAASKLVAEWSDSKKAAFEQRTGLTLEKSQGARSTDTIKRTKKSQQHLSED